MIIDEKVTNFGTNQNSGLFFFFSSAKFSSPVVPGLELSAFGAPKFKSLAGNYAFAFWFSICVKISLVYLRRLTISRLLDSIAELRG